MKFNISSISKLLLLACLLQVACKQTEDLVDFTEADEIALGEKLAAAIAEDADFSIIPSAGNSIPYGYATSRLNEITSSSHISKGEDFAWTIYLLDDEERQAFAFPGGHIFVTSGMIFFLDNEDQFSGLLAHMVAHVDQSHITEALFFRYGVNGLKEIASSGDAEDLKSVIDYIELTGEFLTFSRTNEIQADTLAIALLAETDQSCDAENLFYEKTLSVQPSQQARFIAAHQLEESRLETITEVVSSFGCDTTIDTESAIRYRSFRNSLP